MRLGERAPAAADRVERRLGERQRQAHAQPLVDLAFGLVAPDREHRLDRQRAERQADRDVADAVVERQRDFEAAAAHVADGADRPIEAGNDAERRSSAPLRRPPSTRTFNPDSASIAAASSGPLVARRIASVAGDVELADMHRLGDRREAARRLDGAAEIVGLDAAGLGEAFAEPAQRLLVEARQRRAARADRRRRAGPNWSRCRRCHTGRRRSRRRRGRAVEGGASASVI